MLAFFCVSPSMSLDDLYRQQVLEHNRNPRNFREMPEATHQARGLNALCGDDLRVYLKITGDSIEEISFQGDACAISMASASMMTEAVHQQSIGRAKELFEQFDQLMLNGESTTLPEELAVLAGVRKFPARIKSARLPWHAMMAALQGQEMATTETGKRGRR